MPIILVGTTPVLLLNPNEKRRRLRIQVQSTNVDANNTGNTFITFGQQPVATVGHPSQGDVVRQADGIEEPVSNIPLDRKYKQAVWAVASAANQSVNVEEEIENGI